MTFLFYSEVEDHNKIGFVQAKNLQDAKEKCERAIRQGNLPRGRYSLTKASFGDKLTYARRAFTLSW